MQHTIHDTTDGPADPLLIGTFFDSMDSLPSDSERKENLLKLAANQVCQIQGVVGARAWYYQPSTDQFLLCGWRRSDEASPIPTGQPKQSIAIDRETFEQSLQENVPQRIDRDEASAAASAQNLAALTTLAKAGEYLGYPILLEGTLSGLIEVFATGSEASVTGGSILAITQAVQIGFNRLSDRIRRQEAEDRFRSAAAAIWDWNLDTDAVLYSDVFLSLVDRTRDDFPPRLQSFINILHPEDSEHVWSSVDRHLNDDEPFDIQLRMLVNEEYRWFRSRAQAQRNEAGKPCHLSGSIHDIQNLKDAERRAVRLTDSLRKGTEELQQRSAELDEFVYVASHDLRAPLRGIDALAKMIEVDDEATLSDASKEKLGLLRARIQRMNKLLDDLLAYSRAGRTPAPEQTVNMHDLIADAAETVTVPEHFTFTIEGTLPALTIDPVPVAQIFRNLIDNAIKHHDGERGTVTVRCQATPDQYAFHVIDDGPGIDPKFHKKIFMVFETLAPRDAVEGSGMGLALARKLAIYLGGDLRVESRKNEGSSFIVRLPRNPIPADHPDPTLPTTRG